MLMQREVMREQMQNQRPFRKRQLYEVSPPKRMRIFKEKMDVSPPVSPDRGPLRFDDEDSPSFIAKSFYSATKKMPTVPIASPGEAYEGVHRSLSISDSLVTAKKSKAVVIISQAKCQVTRKNIRYAKSFGCERPNDANGSTSVDNESQSSLIGDENVESRERNASSKSSALCKKAKNNKTKRIALSPVKINKRSGSVEEEASNAEFSAAQKPASSKKRRASSVCSSLQPKPTTSKRSISQPVQSAHDGTASDLVLTKSQKFSKKMVPSSHRHSNNHFGVPASTVESKNNNIATILTPPSKRKFFKTKSPASNIIVGKGFNLKFVRPLKKDSNRSVAKKKRPKQKSSGGKKTNVVSADSQCVSWSQFSQAKEVDISQPSSGSIHCPMRNSADLVRATYAECMTIGSESQSSFAADIQTSSVDGSVSTQSWPLLDDVSRDTSNPSSPSLQTEKDSDEEEVKFYSIFSNRRGHKQVAINRNYKKWELNVLLKDHTLHSFANKAKQGEVRPPTYPPDLPRFAHYHFTRSTVSKPVQFQAIVSSILSVSPEDGAKVQKIFPAHSDNKQLVLDAGQEKFGATQCQVCGMVYTPTDPTDDATHSKFHQHAVSALRFPGWKKENVVKEYLEDGSRVIVVVPEDRRHMVKKVEEVNQVMGQELGFPDQVFSFHGSYKAFLYISENKMIEGCCIAEAITHGYPIMPPIGSQDVTDSRPWLCSNTPQPASVGIGRLWVYGPSRQKGIATRLLDCVRQWFEYGILIPKERLAFSDPTPDGRNFAAKYTGTPHFLVYKYNHGH